MSSRIQYYDVLRGIAIVFVVSIHSLNYSKTTGINVINLIIWRDFIGFAVPLFITLSGFFIAPKSLKEPNSYLEFLKRQLPRVLVPYIVWSLFYSLQLYRGGEQINTILFKFFTFQAAAPFYFIGLIVQFYLLAPIVQRYADKKGLIGSALLSVIYCGLLYQLRYAHNISIPIVLYAGLFFPYLFFFVLGVYLGKGNVLVQNRIICLSMVAVTYGLCVLNSYLEYQRYLDFNSATSAVGIVSFLNAFFVICFLFNPKNANTRNTILSYIGKVSFGVFFTHIFVLNKLARIIDLYVVRENVLFFQVSMITITLLICVTFCWVFRKLNKNIAIKIFGL